MIERQESTVTILDEDILLINVRQNYNFTLRDFKELKIASIRLAKHKGVYSIIDIGEKTIPDKEAREACSFETGNGWIKAEAIVVHSLGQRIVARHNLKQKRDKYPVKLFTNIEKAKGWINRVKKDLDLAL